MKMLTCVEFITLESMHVASTNKDQNFAPAIPVGKSIYERYTVGKALYNPNLRCYIDFTARKHTELYTHKN